MIKVALLLALAAGAGAGIHASGDGSANRGAFVADVARRLDIRLPQRPAAPRPQNRLDTRTLRYRGRSLSIDATAQYLGITEREVRAELRLGGSLADVARTHGGTVDGLQHAIETEVSRRFQSLSVQERLQLSQRLDDILRRDGRPAGWSGRGGP